ncbi:hypothetical protein BK648_23550 [Pseudomonas poae]|uniref:Uncharacterized protein n=1 Tax=Pseudomonas poae TaxID=200451 RepID=A0A423ER29_9PSED|nr:hypothetical protein BK648_23550 [Pseudomonas poae]
MQPGFQLPGQLTGLDVVAAKAFDSAAGHFKNMEKVLSGRNHLIKDRIQVPIGVSQAVVLAPIMTC